MNNDVLYAYLAGSIDCDGFISIQRTRKTKGEKYAHQPIYYTAKIGFTSTDPGVPSLFKETFGGSLYEHQPKNETHKRWYVWQATNDKAGSAIKSLLPFLKLKKPQAEIALKFQDLLHGQRNRFMGNRISPEMEEGRRALWEELTKHNAPRNRRVHFAETP